jgi:hypothetical protein
MTSKPPREDRSEHVTEWVTGVHIVEMLEALAEAGDAAALERAGTVYVRCGAPSLSPDRMSANGGVSGALRL